MTCTICEKLKEKKALIVYEDDNFAAVLPSKPASIGHIKIFPKQHATRLEELNDEIIQDFFFLANYSSASVFEALQAHGTNIILNESDAHLTIDVIPRKENDGMNFMWKPKQLTPEEMEEAFNKIKDSAFTVGKAEQSQSSESSGKLEAMPQTIEEKPPEIVEKDDETKEEVIKVPEEEKTNYLIKQLEKIP